MPTAPTRIKLSPALLSLLSRIYLPCLFFGDVLTLPVRLRPPEMGIVVVIGVFCRYWEGENAKAFRISGRETQIVLALVVGCCLLRLGAGESFLCV
mgnify:CR=1 FL=1